MSSPNKLEPAPAGKLERQMVYLAHERGRLPLLLVVLCTLAGVVVGCVLSILIAGHAPSCGRQISVREEVAAPTCATPPVVPQIPDIPSRTFYQVFVDGKEARFLTIPSSD